MSLVDVVKLVSSVPLNCSDLAASGSDSIVGPMSLHDLCCDHRSGCSHWGDHLILAQGDPSRKPVQFPEYNAWPHTSQESHSE